MKAMLTDIDGRVGEAFEDLINWAEASALLGKIAMPAGRASHDAIELG